MLDITWAPLIPLDGRRMKRRRRRRSN